MESEKRVYTEIESGQEIEIDEQERITDILSQMQDINLYDRIKDLKDLVTSINKSNKFRDAHYEKLTTCVGDIGEVLSDLTSKSDLEEKFLKNDNVIFDRLKLFGFIRTIIKGANKVGDSVFISTDEGMCIKLCNLANLVAHSSKDIAAKHAKKAGVRVSEINDIREGNKIGGILDRIDKSRTEEYNLEFEDIDKALEKGYDPDNETIKIVHELMDKAWIKKDKINEKTTKDFIDALKTNNLKSILYNVKDAGLEAALHCIICKKKVIEEEKTKGTSKDIIQKKFGLEAHIQACEEKKSSSDSTYTARGEKTIRIIAHCGAALPLQFHISKRSFYEIQDRLKYKIERDDRAFDVFKDSVSIADGTYEENEERYHKNEEFLTREEKDIRDNCGSKKSRDIYKREKEYYYSSTQKQFDERHYFDLEEEKRKDSLPAIQNLGKPTVKDTIVAVAEKLGTVTKMNKNKGDEPHGYREM